MNEPLSNLAAKSKEDIRKEIQPACNCVHNPIVYVTHDQEKAMAMSDHIAVLNDGGIEQIRTPDEFYQRPRDPFVPQFIGNPSMNFVTGTVEGVFQGILDDDIDGETVELETTDNLLGLSR